VNAAGALLTTRERRLGPARRSTWNTRASVSRVARSPDKVRSCDCHTPGISMAHGAPHAAHALQRQAVTHVPHVPQNECGEVIVRLERRAVLEGHT